MRHLDLRIPLCCLTVSLHALMQSKFSGNLKETKPTAQRKLSQWVVHPRRVEAVVKEFRLLLKKNKEVF